jgi:hypothetical protein
MKDPKDIKKQKSVKSDHVTPKDAAERAKGDKWAPHVRDGVDALEKAFSKEELKKWSQLVAETWIDDTFKERLKKDPVSALKAYGILVPEGIELRVVENTEKVRYITLPPKPAADVTDLRAGDLTAAAVAASCCSTSWRCRPPTWADTWIILTA